MPNCAKIGVEPAPLRLRSRRKAAVSFRWYVVAVVIFAIVGVGGGAVFPMLPYVDASLVATVVDHIALRFILGISGGVLFFISVYFLFMDAVRRTEHKKAVGSLFIFTVSIMVSWTVDSLFVEMINAIHK